MLFCMGGTFALFPAQAMRVYGASGASAYSSKVLVIITQHVHAQQQHVLGASGASVYSIMFTAFGSAALLGPIASNALLQRGEKPAPRLRSSPTPPRPCPPTRSGSRHSALLPRAGGYPLVFSVLGLCSFGSAALTLASQ